MKKLGRFRITDGGFKPLKRFTHDCQTDEEPEEDLGEPVAIIDGSKYIVVRNTKDGNFYVYELQDNNEGEDDEGSSEGDDSLTYDAKRPLSSQLSAINRRNAEFWRERKGQP